MGAETDDITSIVVAGDFAVDWLQIAVLSQGPTDSSEISMSKRRKNQLLGSVPITAIEFNSSV